MYFIYVIKFTIDVYCMYGSFIYNSNVFAQIFSFPNGYNRSLEIIF